QMTQEPSKCCDVVEFIETLQHVIATLRWLLGHLGKDLIHPTLADHFAVLVGNRQYDAAVHPTRYVGLTIAVLVSGNFGVGFTSCSGFNLAGTGPIMN